MAADPDYDPDALLPGGPAGAPAALTSPPPPSPSPAGRDAVVDGDTSLLDNRVFVVTFERSVASARRHLRPLSLVLLDVSGDLPPAGNERRVAFNHVGNILRATLRDSDVACRLGTATFGLILEDTAESGGVWAAERVQIAAAASGRRPSRIIAAVATYPNHGLEASELLARAGDALSVAQRRRRERGIPPVEVAREAT